MMNLMKIKAVAAVKIGKSYKMYIQIKNPYIFIKITLQHAHIFVNNNWSTIINLKFQSFGSIDTFIHI